MSRKKIIIIGAGPAGLTAAIFLGKNRIPVTLIEKDPFPRDKVCGDCLGGYAISVLEQISPSFFERFIHFEGKISGRGVKFFGPENQEICVSATNLVGDRIPEVALSKRIDFDRFLLDEVLKYPVVEFLKERYVNDIKRENGRLALLNKEKKTIDTAELIILASGSNLSLVRKVSDHVYDKKEFAAGVRTYFEGVEGLNAEPFIELHFLKELAPGYLWIFPLKNNLANVGLGLRSDVISRKNIDLKKALMNIIRGDTYFRKRFKNARQIDPVRGFPLALNTRKRILSGDNYLLTGDAANLIEPLFGEGIGHAMYSGKFAAEQAMEAIGSDNYSGKFLADYDRRVYDKLNSTFQFSRLMHQVAFYPGLMNYLFNRVRKNPELMDQMYAIINGKIPKTPFSGIKFIARVITGI